MPRCGRVTGFILSPPRNYPRAAFLALAAFSGWTVSDALLKLARVDGTPQGEILLVSGISGMAVIFLLSALRGNIRHLQPHKWQGLFALALCQGVNFFCWLLALPYLPLANMYVVSFLTPLTVSCLAALFLKEQLGWKRVAAITAGFAGVVIAVNPANLISTNGAWLPYLAVFGSMLGCAGQMFVLRAMSGKESGESTSFYPRLGLIAIGLVLCSATGFAALKPWVFIVLCGSGLFGGLSWALMAQAYKHAAAAAVAPFQYWQMIIGAAFGYLIWGDVPNSYLLYGTAVIVASGLYLIRHERRISRMLVRVE